MTPVPRRQPHPTTPPAVRAPSFRSGAVARMAQMPVATLRIWEQRYQAVRPDTAPSGHRLYSAQDLQRVLLLRRLTEQGHAIGAIAALTDAQLQAVARTQADVEAGPGSQAGRPAGRSAAVLRLVVVGAALASRLQRLAVNPDLAAVTQVVAVFDSLADAARAARATRTAQDAPGMTADLLVWMSPGLQASVPEELAAARAAWCTRAAAVVYRYAGAAARRAYADVGVTVLREPADDVALAVWLQSMAQGLAAGAARRALPADAVPADALPADALPAPAPAAVPTPRRFDDRTLTAIAGLPPSAACECPRHLAELLMQLGSFEDYSAECADRGPPDAALHAYLQQVAGTARAMFESALERVARQEGLDLR